ncbi:MAG TPA: MFS transporter [Roseiflexaceae bacterium]|nr:MFS transporter [Roseiflexaceae bacterium]
MLTLFRSRLFVAVTSGHLAVDMLNSVVPVLLATLAVPLALTNAQIGGALTLQIFAGSLSQPIFGLLADRFRGRTIMLAGVGLAWMAICLIAAVMSGSWGFMLPLLGLMTLGSGLFHPIGTATAAAAHPRRPASATAMFFFSGQSGLALGPLIGGLLLTAGNTSAPIIGLCLVSLIPAVLMWTAPQPGQVELPGRRAAPSILRVGAFLIIAFVVLVALRSSIQSVYMSFLPKVFADRGWDPASYGAIAGIFMFTAAIGNIVAGSVADRFGMRAATIWPSLLSVPAGLICFLSPNIALAFIACGIAGLVVGGQHSVLVLHAQRLLPVRQGFAAGLILGFTFAAGGIGTWIAGIAADQVGLLNTMQAVTLLGLPVALLSLTLPGRDATTTPVPLAVEQV